MLLVYDASPSNVAVAMPYVRSFGWETPRGGMLALCLATALAIASGTSSGCAAVERAPAASARASQPVSFTLSAVALPRISRVVSVQATEGLSLPYELTVGLWIADTGLDAGRALRTRATLRVHHGSQARPLVYHGIWVSLEYLYQRDGESLYRGVLVPKLYELGFERQSRSYLDKSVPEIASAVLGAHGMGADDYELRLKGEYPTIEQLTQYDQSDLGFLSHRLEKGGLYFYFEQGEHHEKLIITDHLSSHQTSPPVAFVPASRDETSGALALSVFTRRHTTGPAAVRLLDYDYRRPTVRLDETAVVAPRGSGTVTAYGELRAANESSRELAQRYAARLAAARVIYRAQGRALGLRAGYLFDLQGHPRADFNQTYLCTQVQHVGLQPDAEPQTKRLLGIEIDEDYQVSLEAVPASVQAIPPLRGPNG